MHIKWKPMHATSGGLRQVSVLLCLWSQPKSISDNTVSFNNLSSQESQGVVFIDIVLNFTSVCSITYEWTVLHLELKLMMPNSATRPNIESVPSASLNIILPSPSWSLKDMVLQEVSLQYSKYIFLFCVSLFLATYLIPYSFMCSNFSNYGG